MAEYHKQCQMCDCKYVSKRKHSKTCSTTCRTRLYNGGFSNSKIMTLLGIFPDDEIGNVFIHSQPVGTRLNICTEESGLMYVYKYKDEYINDDFIKIHKGIKIINQNESVSAIMKKRLSK